MTLQRFRELTKELPGETQIILQADAEGNGYSPLAGIDEDVIYIPNNTHSGDVYDRAWTADDADMSEKEWEITKQLPISICLFPIN